MNAFDPRPDRPRPCWILLALLVAVGIDAAIVCAGVALWEMMR